jgi:hypothetical protein
LGKSTLAKTRKDKRGENRRAHQGCHKNNLIR